MEASWTEIAILLAPTALLLADKIVTMTSNKYDDMIVTALKGLFRKKG